MKSQTDELKIFFLPFLTPGHMIPMIDTARLFAKHGVNVTIITTPANALLFQKSIDRDTISGSQIQTHILPFPSVGLPPGIENFNTITSPEMAYKLFAAISMLQTPIEQFFQTHRPDCIVTDMFYPWTVDVAARMGIPRLIFHGTSFFSLCAAESVKLYAPHESVRSDSEKFLLPGLPEKVEMTKLQLPGWVRNPNGYTKLMVMIKESEKRSYGAVMNSFSEMEKIWEENYKSVMGIKAWSIGPVALWVNGELCDKVERGNRGEFEEHECLDWLDLMEEKSVLYVSFGSLTKFPASQITEIAKGLEDSGHRFIWVIRKNEKDDDGLPEKFEERMKEMKRGLIIKGWAPQLLILEHPAIGAMVTHCGWNSILEGVNASVPMITWPLFAEQFYNEKLVTEVLGIGVGVGVKEWCDWNGEGNGEVVMREEVAAAVGVVMGGGDAALVMRERVRELGDAAKKAIESGGSSENNLRGLIEELKLVKKKWLF